MMNTNSSTFLMALIQELMKNMTNWHGPENWDADMLGAYKTTYKSAIVSKFNELFSSRITMLPAPLNQDGIQDISRIQDSIEGLTYVYDLLADEPSKSVWENSGEKISYSANGPATSLAINRQDSQDSSHVSTLSIDDFVREKELPRVDFIKMDIEGAELGALKGAEETLRAFRPRLGISVYHKENDLIEIPTYLDKLGIGYKFFLDHFTIYNGETVLFATTK